MININFDSEKGILADNFVLQSDSYKYTHDKQYPPETEEVYSYFESRGGRFREITFFGMQYYLKRYLAGVRVTHELIDEAKAIITNHLMSPEHFNDEGWRRIVDVHGGMLPLEIKAVPEGYSIPVRNILFSIRNTDPKLPWLSNYTETLLSKLWYPCTVATHSREIKKVLRQYLLDTGCEDIENILPFRMHDFGYRGVSAEECAMIGGASALINSKGTDTVAALRFIMAYYNTNNMAGYSIPASEHSTITSYGQERELEAYKNMLRKYPSGTVACVSDSYDIYNACWELWGTELKDEILNRDGTLVIRPDSGDPASVVLKVINILGDRFGFTVNAKGYKVLDPHVRIIQGDGVNYESITEILTVLKENKWATENIAFGSGGALLQKFDRDTQKFALKCSYTKNAYGEINVFKNPITDPGKRSKDGKLKLVRTEEANEVVWDTRKEWFAGDDFLETVFLNGKITKEYTFEEVRANSEVGL